MFSGRLRRAAFLPAGPLMLFGIMLSAAPWDWQLHNSYFIVGPEIPL